MIKISKNIFIILTIILGYYNLFSQNFSSPYYNTPYDFTNRPLGMLSDASAVQWNPGVFAE